MRLWRWAKGRQESGYHKMLLARSRYGVLFDLYLLKFPPDSEVPKHRDTVTSGRHFRLNWIIKKAQKGGEFCCESVLYDGRRLKMFRPDLYNHWVTRVETGNRWVLSLGWVRKAKGDDV